MHKSVHVSIYLYPHYIIVVKSLLQGFLGNEINTVCNSN